MTIHRKRIFTTIFLIMCAICNALSSETLFPKNLPSAQWTEFKAAGYEKPVAGIIYRKETVLWCGMPLGGLATGCIDIENNGYLGYSSIFSHIWGHDPSSDGGPRWRNVIGQRQLGKDGPHVPMDIADATRYKVNMPFAGLSIGDKVWLLSTEKIGNLSSADQIDYWGHYPILDMEYSLDAPVTVAMRCWSPFLPGDAIGSNVPGAVFEVHLQNKDKQSVAGKVVLSFPGPFPRETKGKPFVCQPIQTDNYCGAYNATDEKLGYILAALDEKKSNIDIGMGLLNNEKRWNDVAHGLTTLEMTTNTLDGSAAVSVGFDLQPEETKVVRYLLAWYSPKWQSDFPYNGIADYEYTKMYTRTFSDAKSVADYLAGNHESLLKRILTWQLVIYQEKNLPSWLRDGLINILHLFPECGFWAAPEPPLGKWCKNDGVYSLVESTVADGQQTCIPCDWYGNLPLVYFFPDLARTTLRALVNFIRDDGAIPFTLGQGLDLITQQQHDRQRTLNGCCFVDMVDRLWLRTGDDEVVKEFYPYVKRTVDYMMSLVSGPANVISTAGDQWYEAMAWPGMSSHVGGVRLATLRLAYRMAEKMGDKEYMNKCQTWLHQGSDLLEKHLWSKTHYMIYNDEKLAQKDERLQTDQKGEDFIANVHEGAGQKSDLVLSHQLDGEWIADLHGVASVFRKERMDAALATIKRLNAPLTTAGLLVVVQPDGKPTSYGARMGGLSTMPASAFITAANFIYEGDREGGLRIAHDCLREITCDQAITWDIPNILIGTKEKKQRVYGTDYYQAMSLWGLPAALSNQTIQNASAPGSLVDRIMQDTKSH